MLDLVDLGVGVLLRFWWVTDPGGVSCTTAAAAAVSGVDVVACSGSGRGGAS